MTYQGGQPDLFNQIIVLGASGHAKVCIELLRAMGEEISFCVGIEESPDQCIGVPVLKGDENLDRLRSEGYYRAFIAIGSNHLRLRLALRVIGQGYQLVNAISPQAFISPTAHLGYGVAIMAGAVINSEASIGDLAIINTGAIIDHDCRIGKAVHIAPQCGLSGNVIIGDLSILGIGCKVIPKIQIGDQAIIGAGGVVISNINSGSTAVGVPAKVIKP